MPERSLFGIVMLMIVLFIVLGMANWISGTAAPNIQKQQDIANYCKDWITRGCSSESALNDPRFAETDERPGLLNTCASVIGKSPEEFPDELNPEADWDKCRAKCPGCPKKSEETKTS